MSAAQYIDTVQKVYIAYYGRPADPAGLAFWTQKLDSVGGNLGSIVDAFGNSQESQDLYAGSSNAQVINAIYQQLFNRDAEPAGLAFYTGLLDNGIKTAASIALDILNGAQNADLATINNKLAVAKEFTAQLDTTPEILAYVGDDAAEAARDLISTVTNTNASKTAALNNVDDTIAAIVAGGQGSTPGDTIFFAAGQQNLVGGGNDDLFKGNQVGFQNGDSVDGKGGYDTVALDLTSGAIYEGLTTKNVERLELNISGANVATTFRATQLDSSLETISISNQSQGVLTIENIQEDSSNSIYFEINDTVNDVVLNFDKQAVAAANSVVRIAVSEVVGSTISLTSDNNTAIETVVLDIQDKAGAVSTLKDLTYVGAKNLVIENGTDGLKFGITDALDASIVKIDATDAEADLSLNISASTTAITVDLGSGNDTLNVGDTFNNTKGEDSLDGGAGDDRLVAVFNSTGTRAPQVSEFETFDLKFNNSASLAFGDVDDVETIIIQERDAHVSIPDLILNPGDIADFLSQVYNSFTGHVDLIDMDNDVTTIQLLDGQAGDFEFRYDNGEDAALNFVWTNNNNNTELVNSTIFENVAELVVTADGDDDSIILGFDVDEEDTTDLTFEVTGNGNLSVLGVLAFSENEDDYPDKILDFQFDTTDNVQDLTFRTTDGGDLFVGALDGFTPDFAGNLIDAAVSAAQGFASIIDLQDLRNLTVEGSDDGTIVIGNLGTNTAASDLRNVNITTEGGGVLIGQLNAGPTSLFGIGGASISEINISIADDSFVGFIAVPAPTLTLDLLGLLGTQVEILAEDISAINVEMEQDTALILGDIFTSRQGDSVKIVGEDDAVVLRASDGTVSGSGGGFGIDYVLEAAKVLDFSELGTSIEVFFGNAISGSVVIGTNDSKVSVVDVETGDSIVGGNGADTIFGEAGNDTIFGGNGSDTIYDGAGIDLVDITEGTQVDDRVLITGTNPSTTDGLTNIDTVNGFDADNHDKLGFAGDAAKGTYLEAAAGVADYAAARVAADAALTGTQEYYVAFSTASVAGGGNIEAWVFRDSNLDGQADAVVLLLDVAVDVATAISLFEESDIIADPGLVSSSFTL